METTLDAAVTFQKGQMVQWNPKRFGIAEQEYGNGPFNVLSVEDVPMKKCTCNLSDRLKEYSFDHEPWCQVNTPNFVGHHQWVIVQTLVGPHHFSGAYFIPV